MRLSIRISFVMLIISIATITLLTILMHFKYHVTRLNLINERLGVVSAEISYPINNALLLGIGIENIKELQNRIEEAKEFDKIISDIVIFKIDKNQIIPVFYTSKMKLTNDQQLQLLQSLRTAKGQSWKGRLNNDIEFSGITLKDIVKQERAGIAIYYSSQQNHKEEEEEVNNLYQRLGLCILITAVLNFLAGLQNTKEVTRIMRQIETAIVSVSQNPENKVDLGKISDPGIRSQMRLMINAITEFSHYLIKADKIIQQFNLTPKDKE